MYTKQESARLHQAFWTAFGQYMAPAPSAGGEKVNWLNYKTGIKHLYFKTALAGGSASVAVVLQHPDTEEQQRHFDQLLASRKVLEASGTWHWQGPAPDAQGKISSRVYCQLDGVSVFNQAHWPVIISFLKPRLMALDAWWQEAKIGFGLLD